jgi:hypothetical protein
LGTHAAGPSAEEDPAVELVGPGPYPKGLIVTGVRYVSGYTIRVQFADGFQRDVDMTDELDGEVFQELKDQAMFRQVRFDPDIETAVWPNGADLAPEFLRWGRHRPDGCECGH